MARIIFQKEARKQAERTRKWSKNKSMGVMKKANLVYISASQNSRK